MNDTLFLGLKVHVTDEAPSSGIRTWRGYATLGNGPSIALPRDSPTLSQGGENLSSMLTKVSRMDMTLAAMPNPRCRLQTLQASALSSWTMLPRPLGTPKPTGLTVAPEHGTSGDFSLPRLCPSELGAVAYQVTIDFCHRAPNCPCGLLTIR